MIAIARGSIAEPEKLGPFIDDEMRVVEQLKAEGVMKAVYRRAAGPGTVIILEGDSMDALRERMNTLPVVVEGLMSLSTKRPTRSETHSAVRTRTRHTTIRLVLPAGELSTRCHPAASLSGPRERVRRSRWISTYRSTSGRLGTEAFSSRFGQNRTMCDVFRALA
jgi:hypothetical protein